MLLASGVESLTDKVPSQLLSAPRSQDINNSASVLNLDGRQIEALVFEGGGTKGIVYAGAIKCLERNMNLQNVKCFAGSSAGAQTAALLAFGYGGEELERLMHDTPWRKLLDGAGGPCGLCRGMCRLCRSKGYYKGDFLRTYLDQKFAEKRAHGGHDCTFQELYDERGVELRIGACNLTRGGFEYLDRASYPAMPVSLAVRASSSIPFLFTPSKYDDNVLVDGCVEGSLPISAFLGKRILAFHLMSTYDAGQPVVDPSTFSGLAGGILDVMMNSAQRKHGVNFNSVSYNDENYRIQNIEIVKIDCGSHGLMEVKLSSNEIADMMAAGFNATHAHFTRRLSRQCSLSRQGTRISLASASTHKDDVLGVPLRHDAGAFEAVSDSEIASAMQTVRRALLTKSSKVGIDALQILEDELSLA